MSGIPSPSKVVTLHDSLGNLTLEEVMGRFDITLERLQNTGLREESGETNDEALDLLSSYIEDCLLKGASMEELQPKVNAMAQFALDNGYSKEFIQRLLTFHPSHVPV